jgi:hypothetical protein
MGEVHHSFAWPPCTDGRASMEAAQQTTTTPQAHPQVPHWDTGYGVDYSGHHEGGSYNPSHGYLEPSLWAGTSASARYPNWYAPLERYVSYGVDQAERAVEGIGWLERRMHDFAHVQMDMQETSMMHDFFSHFRINPDA